MEKEKTLLVSIVIPSWLVSGQDGKYGLNETFVIADKCLRRIIECTPKGLYEIILIDNGSTLEDASDYWKLADVVIKNEKNLGFAPAMNQGFALARGKYVVNMNNDILVWEGWLETLLRDFEVELFSPKCGLLMPAIIKEKDSFFNFLKKDKRDIDMKTNAGKFGLNAEFGSCWLAERKVLRKVSEFRDGYQVFDENFKIGFGEDRWLYREIRMLGLETYRTHNLRVLHVGNLSIGKMKKKPGVREAIDKNREYLEELKDKHKVD